MDNSYEEFKENDLTGWADLTEIIQEDHVHVMMEIIDDGLTNGFEFKLQGSHIYYRERTE